MKTCLSRLVPAAVALLVSTAIAQDLSSDYVAAAHRMMHASKMIETVTDASCKAQRDFYLERAAKQAISDVQAAGLSELWCKSAKTEGAGWPRLVELFPLMAHRAGYRVEDLDRMTQLYEIIGVRYVPILLTNASKRTTTGPISSAEMMELGKEFLKEFASQESDERLGRFMRLSMQLDLDLVRTQLARFLGEIDKIAPEVVRTRHRAFCGFVKDAGLGRLPANNMNYATRGCD
jgi:hypothetical protein